MTKITKRYDIFRRYLEDFWGFFHIKKNYSLAYYRIEQHRLAFLRTPITRFLDITAPVLIKKKRRRLSFYGRLHYAAFQLRRYFVNLNKRQLFLISKKVNNIELSLKRNFAFSLESRVDAILLRINLFTSVKTVKQWINHGFILVNLKPIWCSNQHLKLGDFISFKLKEKKLLKNYFFQRYFFPEMIWNYKSKQELKQKYTFFLEYENLNKIPFFLPKYLDLNYRLFFFILWRAPKWREIPFLKKFKSSQILSFPYKRT